MPDDSTNKYSLDKNYILENMQTSTTSPVKEYNNKNQIKVSISPKTTIPHSNKQKFITEGAGYTKIDNNQMKLLTAKVAFIYC